LFESKFDVYSTTPQSKDIPRGAYLSRVAEVAQWSEEFGYSGILVYTDNGLVDPWLVAQRILETTSTICPLVAVQPIYMHPYTAAKMVATLGYLHSRRVCLNMLAGGFKTDLAALGDETPHDDRYVRTVEYTQILQHLLGSSDPLTFAGKYYSVSNLRLTPPLPDDLFPGLLISGSSPAGMAAARELGCTAIRYPQPPEEVERVPADDEIGHGVRVGIIARTNEEEAWRVAHERFPETRRGQLKQQLAMKVSDSAWHKQISELDQAQKNERSTYWLGPFNNYQTFCPYLVGSYERVSEMLSLYLRMGYRTLILDIPASHEELEHTRIALEAASETAGS